MLFTGALRLFGSGAPHAVVACGVFDFVSVGAPSLRSKGGGFDFVFAVILKRTDQVRRPEEYPAAHYDAGNL